MPLYEFECPDCQKVFEELVRFSDADKPVTCPGCGAEEARRLLSAPALGGGLDSGSSGGCAPRGGFT